MTKLVYIVAASHSGSTLLTMLLNSHPDVATIGELSPGHIEDLSFYLCSCGIRIRECPFWRYITIAMKENNNHFNLQNFGTRFDMPDSVIANSLLGPLHRGPALELLRDYGLKLLTGWPTRFEQIMHTNTSLIEAVLEYYNASIFVDKGNRALRLKYLLRIPSLDVKVIHLVRDGRAVALTYMDPAEFADAKELAMRGGGSGDNRESERLSLTQAAYQWKRCNQEAEYVLKKLSKSQWIEVRYEDLCVNTQSTLKRIYEFICLDPQQAIKNFRSVEHHVVGNGMRLDTTFEIRLDERWRSVLTQSDLQIFDRKAGEMNRKYGYKYFSK